MAFPLQNFFRWEKKKSVCVFYDFCVWLVEETMLRGRRRVQEF